MARNLGMVTAYAYAVAGGYTGTEAEFEELLGNIADDLSQIENLSVTVTTLTPGSSATASYSNGVLALGIPRGNTGATGNGISAIIKTGTSGLVDTYTVTYTNGQTMTYTVTNGAKGDTGNGIASIALTSTSGAVKTYTVTFTDGSTFTFDVTDGEVTNESLAEALEDFSANGTVANAEQLTTDIRANDQTPYLFRTSGGSVDIGDREYINGIVGVTMPFNQIRGDASLAVQSHDGIDTSYDGNTHKFCIKNVSRTTNYSSGSTRYDDFAPAILNHVYAITSDKDEDGVGVAAMQEAGRQQEFAKLNSIVKLTNTTAPYVYFRERITYEYDFTSRHPIGDEFYFTMNIIDLTLMFGSTIADYIYSLEQANAGAGVAFFKTLFPKPYYAYNAGELMSVKGLVSHDMVGFNAWDEEWELGSYDNNTGAKTASSTTIRSKNKIKIVPNTVYHFEGPISGVIFWYDAEENFIGTTGIPSTGHITPTSPANACYMAFRMASGYGTTYNHDICINLSWDGSEDGNYEPYQKWSYPLDSDLELRGIPKIENGNLYYDGDTYESDGTVTRKYGITTFDGTEEWYSVSSGADANTLRAMNTNFSELAPHSGEYTWNIIGSYIHGTGAANSTPKLWEANFNGNGTLIIGIPAEYDTVAKWTTYLTSHPLTMIYELATPTTETADPYTSPQIVSDFGTEEYVIDDDVFAIPVGHNTDYPVDLKAKLEMAPNSPPGDGMYVVKQTSGTNEYVPLIIPSGIPPVPTENGSYTLTATVSGGTTTLSWS